MGTISKAVFSVMGFKNAIRGIKHSWLAIITQLQQDSDAKRMAQGGRTGF